MALSALLNPLLPFVFVIPITVKSTFQTRMVFPSGSSVPKRFSTIVGPITATLSLLSEFSSVINIHEVTLVLLTVEYAGITPLMVVFVFLLPYITCFCELTSGETFATSSMFLSIST